MHPDKVERDQVHQLTDLPNIGKAMAKDLEQLGISAPKQLCGRDPYELYLALCDLTGQRQDPCVLDVFISITRFADGEPPKAWWHYTAERKTRYRL
ncbi:helix-hairpin-helix domain-containing protein [Shewanella yunxiaonensis]|uniref:Helix-hairpin-helix domain-containing protein n=1 Tax=Shewanella yunxiaonensis TaxID=2829809 RepID=A0ABX7YWB8_9GAMM|nr:helix-hairpin-helix domain-containing protein [Shewanella yunxiaonensis]QUN07112.1 helix-hairpin-helix domain-containing protein [Shewanella yunxiaonensis]